MTTPQPDPLQPSPLPPDPPQPDPSPLPPEPPAQPDPSPLPHPDPSLPDPDPAQPGPGTYDPADAAVNRHQAPGPLPVTPSDKMPRPEGLAFDVEPGADLTGMPVGDQTARNPGAEHIEETVRESGESIGLAIPATRPQTKSE
jgi:hypothetical protein